MMEKEHKNETNSHLLGIVSQLNDFHTISSQHTIHKVLFHESTSLLPKGIGNNMIFLSNSVTHLKGQQKEDPGWLPRITQITHN